MDAQELESSVPEKFIFGSIEFYLPLFSEFALRFSKFWTTALMFLFVPYIYRSAENWNVH